MSSSLDDRPEYENLQDELDQAAQRWVSTLQQPVQVLKLLHQYIAYLCDELYLDDSRLIDTKVAQDYIHVQDLSVWQFKGERTAEDYIMSFTLHLKR